MPKPERDPLRELALLLRAPEEGETNLGVFVSEHAEALAPTLGIDVAHLQTARDRPDETIAPVLRARLDRLRLDARNLDVQRAGIAARELARKATWLEDERVVLDVDLVLGDLLVDRSKKYIRFVDDSFDVAVRRSRIAECRPLRRTFMDLVAFVNNKGLSFRWRAARGRLNFLPQEVDDVDRALVVALSARRLARHAWQAVGEILRDGYLT